jgi:hypothetical protein
MLKLKLTMNLKPKPSRKATHLPPTLNQRQILMEIHYSLRVLPISHGTLIQAPEVKQKQSHPLALGSKLRTGSLLLGPGFHA